MKSLIFRHIPKIYFDNKFWIYSLKIRKLEITVETLYRIKLCLEFKLISLNLFSGILNELKNQYLTFNLENLTHEFKTL